MPLIKLLCIIFSCLCIVLSSEITSLDIKIIHNQMLINCQNELIDIDEVPSFDAQYLKDIDSSTFELMINRCENTISKIIIFKLSHFNRLIIDETFLKSHSKLMSFKLENFMQNNSLLLETGFLKSGHHLNTLTINGFNIIHANYLNNLLNITTIDLTDNSLETIEFQQELPTVELILGNNKISSVSSLSQQTKLLKLDLSKNQLTHIDNKPFAQLRKLKWLNLSLNNIVHFIINLPSLQYLDFSQNHHLTGNLTNLVYLNLSGCNLNETTLSNSLEVLNLSNVANFDVDLQNLTKLRLIDLSFNNLRTLPKLNAINLQEIYLQNNSLKSFNYLWFSKMNLKIINLSYNSIMSFENTKIDFKANEIDLKGNRLKEFPNDLVNVVELKQLDLSNNLINSVILNKSSISANTNVEIDLTNNQVSKYSSSLYDATNQSWNLIMDLSLNRIRCNCLKYKIDEIRTNLETVIMKSTNSEDICYTNYPEYNCPLINIVHCPTQCTCYYQRIPNAIIVDCANLNLEIFPKIQDLHTDRYEHRETVAQLNGNKLDLDGQEFMLNYTNVSKLDLSFNMIEELAWVPPNLIELDLSNNQLSNLNSKLIESLEADRILRNISLKNNPWECNCESLSLQKYLQEKNNLLLNSTEVLCRDSNLPLVTSKICQNVQVLRWAIPLGVVSILAIIAFLMVVYFMYSTSIKVYLYSKNMCLWCVTEDELDKDKTYDVFVSFSHKDENFVTTELVPVLESGDPPFKVCIHYRDFVPGEFINKQIVDAVLDSRRTLVVLSDNFMESVWGKMEFRTAHLQAINEGRARVIVVLYGTLNRDSLDDEMKTYLRTNTYVEWGDPWFWKKLKYALPHSKYKTKNKSNSSIEIFHLN